MHSDERGCQVRLSGSVGYPDNQSFNQIRGRYMTVHAHVIMLPQTGCVFVEFGQGK